METGDRNDITTKNKRTNPDRLELKKYSHRNKIIEKKTGALHIRSSFFN
ncbi:50S ribosomal protein L33 [Bacillus sp. SKDU12]|nr:50S ribosomal protein L33 [Bacillus sp. SKDU12]